VIPYTARSLLAVIGILTPMMFGTALAAAAVSIDRLLEASGTRHAIAQIPATIAASLDTPQPGVDLPHDVRLALKDAAAQAYQAEQLIKVVRDRMGRDLSEGQVGDVMTWVATALGKRIVELEKQSSDPSAMRSIEAYARDLQRSPPPAARVALARELNAASGSAEVAAALVESMTLATALGLNAAQPRQSQVPNELLEQDIKNALPQMRQQAEGIVLVSILYTYRSLSDAELSQYLRFMQTPSGAAYARSGAAAMREALAQATGRFMLAIPKAMARSRGKGQV
jgi:hypothetical protein